LMQYLCSSRSIIFAENNNATRTAYTLSLTCWLHANDTVCWQEKIHVCAWRYPAPPCHSTPPMLHLFSWKKITSDTFWTAHVNMETYTKNRKRELEIQTNNKN
jgi:hypothetical protein